MDKTCKLKFNGVVDITNREVEEKLREFKNASDFITDVAMEIGELCQRHPDIAENVGLIERAVKVNKHLPNYYRRNIQ